MQPSRERKSLGRETTFATDTSDATALRAVLGDLSAELGVRLSARNLQGRTVTLKVKYADFTQITRRLTLPMPTAQARVVAETAGVLLEDAAIGSRKVRLLGLSLSNFAPAGATAGPLAWVEDA